MYQRRFYMSPLLLLLIMTCSGSSITTQWRVDITGQPSTRCATVVWPYYAVIGCTVEENTTTSVVPTYVYNTTVEIDASHNDIVETLWRAVVGPMVVAIEVRAQTCVCLCLCVD